MSRNKATGFLSTDHPDHAIINEIGHFLHRHAVFATDLLRMSRASPRKKSEKMEIANKVSDYAATFEVEIVAEVYVQKVLGFPIDPVIQAIYTRLGGPEPVQGAAK